MGWSETHILLTFQWYMTFTLPHQRIFNEIKIFSDFVLSVWMHVVTYCSRVTTVYWFFLISLPKQKKVKNDLPDWFHLLQEMETQTYLPTYHTSKLTTNLCRFIEWTCQSMQQSYQFIWCLWQFKESSSNFTNMVISVHSFWNALSIHGVIMVP